MVLTELGLNITVDAVLDGAFSDSTIGYQCVKMYN